ncbi:hypothetical protein D3C84_1038440 [compost metagenome]
MSAYSASAPVNASTTAPRIATPMPGWTTKKRTAQAGFTACNTSGCCRMPYTPRAPSTRNQVTMIGPNRMPIRAVPWRWIRNSPTSTTSDKGTTQWSIPSNARPRPSIAESTEMAGVIMLSP